MKHLAAAGHSLWQVLPLGPVGAGNSPYTSFSAFAGEPLLISPELLAEDGWLQPADLDGAPQSDGAQVDYEVVRRWKFPLLDKAYRNFEKRAEAGQRHAFQQFCADHSAWLDDYALFLSLRKQFGEERSWTEWDADLAKRNPAALHKAAAALKSQIACEKFIQFAFYRQWSALREFCRDRQVRILGDIPIYVSHESADVWAHPKEFLLDEKGRPEFVSGVPPDYFSETGQLWGNPIYNWREMERTGFRWWIERFRGTFRLYDALRIDHFRGFEAYWQVPASEKTAVNGEWVKAPGEKLFRSVTSELGELEIVAENLGVITFEVEQLREEFRYPGMAILQFAFGIEGNAASYRPHNLIRDVVAYTGTHDNDTVVGWWNASGGDTRSEEDIRKEKDFTLNYLGNPSEPIEWAMIRALYASVARVAIIPMQDALGLGSEARMNRPGVADGNWTWRMAPHAFDAGLAKRLRELAELYDRAPGPDAELQS